MTATPYTYRAIGVISGGPLRALPGSTVTVYFTGTTVKAVLFNAAGVVISNPMIADSNGNALFYTAPGTYDIRAQIGSFIDNCTIRIVDSGAGTNADSFRGQGNGSDLAALQAATAYAIANNAWPIRIPSTAAPFDLGGGTWYVNATGAIDGAPVDGIAIAGDAVGNLAGTTGACITNGRVSIGCGPSYTVGGNKIDASVNFVSRCCYVAHLRIIGALECWGLQLASIIENVIVIPTGVAGTTRGVRIVFSNTLVAIGLRSEQAGPTLDGITTDTSSDFTMIGGGTVLTRHGYTNVQEIGPYNPPQQYSVGGATYAGSQGATGIRLYGVHFEQDYYESCLFYSIASGFADIRVLSGSTTNFVDGNGNSIPRVRIGYPYQAGQTPDPNILTTQFTLCGDVNGLSSATAGTLVEFGYCATAKIENCRLRGLPVGQNVTSFCSDWQCGSGVRYDNSVTTPVQFPDGVTLAPTRHFGGWQILPFNSTRGVAIGQFLADDQGARIFLDRYASDTISPFLAQRSARGTVDVPLKVNAGDDLSSVSAFGYGATAFQPAGQYKISCIDPTPSNTSMAAALKVYLSAVGSISPSLIQQIDWTSGLQLFNLTRPFVVTDGGVAFQTFTKATLPAASARTGYTYRISDAAAGKGRSVYSNGTAWLYENDSSAI